MKVLFVASECTPLAKVGGLADVVGSLPKTLKELGLEVFIALPFYEIISRKDVKLIKKNLTVEFEGKEKKFSLWQTLLPNSRVPVFLIENKEYFKGKGVYIEGDASSGGSKAEAARFLFLSVAGIKIAKDIKADIIHCHDWHAATIPFLTNIKTFLTIHNFGYQGIYPTKIANNLLKTNLKEFNSLKLGIKNADLISTVSPNYAKEILTPEYGFKLEKELKKRKKDLLGIINGLDVKYWNPKTDPFLKTNYNIKNLKKKEQNKIYLQKNLFKKDIPLIGLVSRLAEQKGIDLIKEIFPQLMKENIQLIVLGKGQPDYEKFFTEMAKKYKNFNLRIGFNEELAHLIYGASDMFLMPSAFEPCGLGQLIAMRYGTLPIVRETGGLKDTVSKETGFLFKDYKAKELLKTIQEAVKTYKDQKKWKNMQINAMKKDFSWKKSAKEYLKVYKKLKKSSSS